MPDTVPPVHALVIVDAQKAFMIGDDAVPASGELIRSLGELLRRARERGAVVVHLQNDGPVGTVDEPHQPGWELYFAANSSDGKL